MIAQRKGTAQICLAFFLVTLHIEVTTGISWLSPLQADKGEFTSAQITTMTETVMDSGPANLHGLPQEVDITFGMADSTAHLRLKKSKAISSDFDIILAGENNEKPMERVKYSAEDFAVYYDEPSLGSFISVPDPKSSVGHSYMGTFEMDKKQYAMEPSTETNSVEDNRYSVYSLDEDPFLPSGEPRVDPERMGRVNSLGSLYNAQSQPAFDPKEYVTQTWIMLDYSVYKQWYDLSNAVTDQARKDEAVANMRFFYSHIVNGMDLRYRSRHNSLGMVFVLTGLYIASTPGEAPWTETYKFYRGSEAFTNAYSALDFFEKWTFTQYNALQPMDQALLFSRYSLASFRTDGSYYQISGLGNIQGTCSVDTYRKLFKGVSINFAMGLYRTTQTAAHEAGHVHGALHDGSQNTCRYNDQYVMASSPYTLTDQTINNPFTFSICSVDYFQRYMRYLNLNQQNCLTNTSNEKESFVDTALETHPGQKFTKDQQCKIIFGSKSFYCGGHLGDKEQCRYMECYNPSENKCVTNVEQRAVNGTTCGNKMWCLKAKCVSDPKAPATSVDYCRSGDYKGKLIGGGGQYPEVTCDGIRAGIYPLSQCMFSTIKDQCCKTCTDLVKNDTSCKYGDENPSYCAKLRKSDCYSESIRKICCTTCGKLKENNPNCEYGDKATWCSGITNSSCYVNENVCCKRCVPGPDPSCKYGDQAGWCSTVKNYQCYSESTRCCKTCKKYELTIPGCKYGDRGETYCNPSKCTVDPVFCCETCSNQTTTTTSTTTMTTATTTTTQTSTTSTTASTTTTSLSTTTTRAADDGCTTQEADWCKNPIYVYICYEDADRCCSTCTSRKTGIIGCEYGDKRSWCKDADETRCQNPDYMSNCCVSCKKYQTTTTTTTVAPNDRTTRNPLLGCTGGNLYGWCENKDIIGCGSCYQSYNERDCCGVCAGCATGTDRACLFGDRFTGYCEKHTPQFCYEERFRTYDCCAFCGKAHTGIAGCEYGDRLPNCPANRCNEEAIKDVCCATCSEKPAVTNPVPAPVPDNCVDTPVWCSSMPARDCYVSEKDCCKRCKAEYTGITNCEYKDKVGWCANHVRPESAKQDCERPGVGPNCCHTCSTLDATFQPRGGRGLRGDEGTPGLEEYETIIAIRDSGISQLVTKSHELVDIITTKINEFCHKDPDRCCKHFNTIGRVGLTLERSWVRLQHSTMNDLRINSAESGDEVLFTLLTELPLESKIIFCQISSSNRTSRRRRDVQATYMHKEILKEIIINNKNEIEQEIEREIIRVGEIHILQPSNKSNLVPMILVPVVFAITLIAIGVIIIYRKKQKTKYPKYVEDPHTPTGRTHTGNHQMTFPLWTNSLTRPSKGPRKTLEAMPNVVTFH